MRLAVWIKILRSAFFSISFISALLSVQAQTATAVNVPTWRYDNTHMGANTQETALTPANVNADNFGKLFSVAVDGYVYAQPLYVSGITMVDGQVHNVIFVVTQHDSVYAFDADTNGGTNAKPLWQASMADTAHGATAGATSVPSTDLGTHDIVPEIGITSTPVYDPTSQTLYVVAKTKENGSYIQRIHALNMTTGAEQAGSPSLPIAATVTGAGNGSSNGQLTFSSMWQMNRVALSLFNGYLYIAFGSHGDNGPWHGWVMAYDAHTLQQTGVICLSPNGFGNGIWGSGGGLPIDTVNGQSRLFLSAGNGSFTSYPPLSSQVDYGNSIVRLDLGSGSLTVGSAFTPFNQAALTAGDIDQGSGGELMLPDQQGAHPHELLQVGKEGRILLMDRDNLGGYQPSGTSNTNVIQDILGQTGGLWSTPAYWNGHVYMWGNGDVLKRFDLTNGLLTTTSTATGSVKSQFPGASPVISSNGTQNGIVWALRTDAYNSNGAAILYAFDATSLGSPLYESDTNPARDEAGPATKFAVPVVTNGKVYIGTAYEVDVYGLLNGAQQAASPVITPNGGSFAGPQQVTISSTSPNSTIYYTTDGSLPTAAATPYTGALTVATGTTIRAVASAQGYLQSGSSATFSFVTQTPAPAMMPAPGAYTSAQVVTISDSMPSAVIHYTTDGSVPTAASPVYSGPVTINNTQTLQAMATSNLTPSAVSGGTYSIEYAGTGINFGSGFASVAGLTLNGSTVHSDDSRLQLTNGGTYEAGSVFYNTPMNVQSFTNDFSFQLSNAQADGFAFVIQNVAPTALGPYGGSLGYGNDLTKNTGGIANSIAVKFDLYSNAGEGPNSTGIYQNGVAPTIPSIDLTSSGINLHSGSTMNVHMTYDGTILNMTLTDTVTGKSFSQGFPINLPQVIGSTTAYIGFTGGTGGQSSSQKILTWTFLSSATIATPAPTISPNGGTFTGSQTVSMSDANASAVIYYTLDGTMPTTASSVYSGPLTISSGAVTFSAIAVAPGSGPSPLTTATITITQAAPAVPTFSPAAGTYVGTQTVAISDSTAGATIYYTTDGSTPTTASNIYSSPISVNASTTVNAIAAVQGEVQTFAVQSNAPSINFTNGFAGAQGLTYNGNAANPNDGTLKLTDANGIFETSSIFYSTPVDIRKFQTTFNFQQTNATADGMTFTIQSNAPTALGGKGGSLGYGVDTTYKIAGIPNSVAIKFDLYNNNGEGTDSTGIYVNGALPMTPSVDLTPSGIVLRQGDPMQATLVYDGTTLTLTLTDLTTQKTFTHGFTINIPGTVNGNTAYVGFTAATGGSTTIQKVLNWTYTATIPTSGGGTGYISGPVGSAAYVIQVAGQSINYGNGFTSASGLALNGKAQVVAATQALELTDGHPNENASAWATTPMNISSFTSDFNFQMLNPVADGFTFAIQSNGTTALGVNGGALGYAGIKNSVALKFDIYNNNGEGTNSIGVYTGGAQPTTPATNLNGTGIVLTSGDVFHAHLVYNGVALQVTITDTKTSTSYTGSFPVDIPGVLGTSLGYVGFTGGTGGSVVTTNILNWTFAPAVQTAAAEPTFNPAPGTYTSSVQVSLSSLTSGATIYYTVDGSQPSHSSTVYSGPIHVNGNSLTVKAFASATGYQDSPIVTGSYVIQAPTVVPPVLSPAAGTYNQAQTVSLSTSTVGATIYYTTDGSTPTTASKAYSSPINVSASTTINAIAVLSGSGQSSITTGAYVIRTTTQPIHFGSGFAGAQGLTYNGNAANPNDGTLKLTDANGIFQTSSIFYSTPVDIRKFQTTFNFQQTNATADGMTFTIQSNAPTALGGKGGSLGYGVDTTYKIAGIPNSVAIKFDLYNNNGEGTDSTGIYVNGALPMTPSVDLTPSGIVLRQGDPMQATLVYDGTTLTLTLTDLTTQKTFTHGFTINIPSTVNGNTAYVGFTAATGGSTAIQKVLNWTYTQTAP